MNNKIKVTQGTASGFKNDAVGGGVGGDGSTATAAGGRHASLRPVHLACVCGFELFADAGPLHSAVLYDRARRMIVGGRGTEPGAADNSRQAVGGLLSLSFEKRS